MAAAGVPDLVRRLIKQATNPAEPSALRRVDGDTQEVLLDVEVDGMRQIEAIDRVTALGRAILQRVFPDFLVVVLLLFVPWRAGGEVESLRIGGPGDSVHFFFALGHRERFPTIGRDEVKLRNALGILFLAVLAFAPLACGRAALGEKCDPAAVGRPAR